MKRLEAQFGNWIHTMRWLVIVSTIAIAIGVASAAGQLRFSADYRIFFADDNPELIALTEIEQRYSKDENGLIVITPKGGDVFTQPVLEVVRLITEAAWSLPFAARVDSITNFQHTEAAADDLLVQDLVLAPSTLTGTELEKIRTIALAEPRLLRRLISPSSEVTAVNVQFTLPGLDDATELPTMLRALRALIDEMRVAYPEIEFRLTGQAVMSATFPEASERSMTRLGPLALILMSAVLAILLRGLLVTGITLVVLALSISVALGMIARLGWSLNPVTAMAPMIILTMALANCVHVLITFVHEMGLGRGKMEAITESLRINVQPVALASLTTALGFLSMNFSKAPPFQQLGSIVAIGVAASAVLALTLLPALLLVLPVRVKRSRQGHDGLMQGLGNFVVERRSLLLWGAGAAILALVACVPRNEFNDQIIEYFDHSYEFRRDSDYTLEHLTGMYSMQYSLSSGESGGISNPAFLQEVEEFEQWFHRQPETINVLAITDTLKRLNANLHGDDPAWYRLPQTRELAAQYLLLYEMSLPYGLDLNNQIDIDKSATRFIATITTVPTKQILALDARAQKWLAENTSHIKPTHGSGTSLMFAHLSERNARSMLLGTTFALLLISGLLMFAFRSLKMGLVSLVPNLAPVAMGFGVWGVLVGEVNIAIAAVSGMTLGIVVDDTIHYISKYLRARREQGLASADAVRYAFITVGRALLVTSIVLCIGFIVLSLSGFTPNSDTGLLTAIVIVLALAADFLFLPPLLMKLEDESDEDTVTVDPASGVATA